jgi:hypothetical protein
MLATLDRLCLPEDVEIEFCTLAENIGFAKRAIGRLVFQYVDQLQYGQQMTAYTLFADLYYKVTGDYISPRTVRAWSDSAKTFTKHDLNQYESLSDSQLLEAVSLSKTAKVPAQQICEWAVETGCASVPAMRAEWLPVTGNDDYVDPPFVSGFARFIRRFAETDPRRAELENLIERVREILRRAD